MRKPIVKKATHAAFLAALDSEMRAVGATIGRVSYQPENPEYTLQTPAGEYTCHADVPIKLTYPGWRPNYFLTITGRFKDADAAQKWAGLRLFNGKFNRHYGASHTPEQVPMLATDFVTSLLTLRPSDLDNK